jgi:prepilin-type N-terminal cleavage/methylation domain-containing protein
MRVDRKQHGFTLIELLVVISIISLMATIVLAALGSARMKARDVQRVQALNEINTAIQIYALDHNGYYPLQPEALSSTENNPDCSGTTGSSAIVVSNPNPQPFDFGYTCVDSDTGSEVGWNDLKEVLSPYINDLPHDSKELPGSYGSLDAALYGNGDSAWGYVYAVSRSNNAYDLYVRLEEDKHPLSASVHPWKMHTTFDIGASDSPLVFKPGADFYDSFTLPIYSANHD